MTILPFCVIIGLSIKKGSYYLKDKVICEYYICKGSCKKNRDADYSGYCKHCDKYYPRKGAKLLNKKYENKLRGEY